MTNRDSGDGVAEMNGTKKGEVTELDRPASVRRSQRRLVRQSSDVISPRIASSTVRRLSVKVRETTATVQEAPNTHEFVGDFDEMLELVGGFGRFQWRLLLLLQPPFMFLAFTLLSQIWLVLEPDHWCRVPQLESSNMTLEEIRNVSIPQEYRAGRQQFSRCLQYDVNFTDVDLQEWRPDNTTPTTSCRNGWNYDFSLIYPTIVSENNWVCDDAWKPTMVSSLFFAGSAIGTILFGYISDKFGRLPGLIIANLTACIAGTISAFSNGLVMFTITRIVFGMANNLQVTLAILFLGEFVGTKYRGMVVNLPLAVSFCVGMAILPWIAWGLYYWSYIAIAVSVPMAFPLVYLVAGVPESCRWLQQKGRIDKAIEQMKKIAKENGKEVPEETWMSFAEAAERQRKEQLNKPESSLKEMLVHYPRLRVRMIVLMFGTMIVLLLFDLTSRNTEFDVDIYTAQTLLAITEMPADLLTWLLVDTLGRRWTISVSTALTSLAAVGLAALLNLGTAPAASTAAAVTCRFCATVAANVLITICMELVPTDVRSRAFSMTQVAGQAATMFSPVILFLERVARGLPQLVAALLGLVGAVVVSCLPETKGRPLPDTLEQGERFGEDQRWLECYCRDAVDAAEEPKQGVENAAVDITDEQPRRTDGPVDANV